ncbi:hypothetical protein G7Z17_g11207 [Cylindrodendrum hubeiense]|uniref:Uncharacterized protein n=1 Tax=Cylindrodendrum hubeiense TaxID=595255 RepID=A0A9P5GWA4_9HYPO|nr:hypothetical protein G7Z17_g11207 [Cylindrodendrum hubeiense]
MPGNEKRWHANAERDLCLAIILGNQETDRARHNWPKVHSIMNDLDYTFTQDAISQHFTKTVMRDFKVRHGKSGTKSTPTSTSKKATPQKRRSTAKQPKSMTMANQGDDEMDDDEVLETPTKKIKCDTGTKALRRIKTENAGSPGRERSATVQDNEAEYQAWLAADEENFV